MKAQSQEMVFMLRMVRAGQNSPVSVWLGQSTDSAIRFDDIDSLARYLRTLVQPTPTRGLK